MHTDTAPEYLNTVQVAARLGCNRSTVVRKTAAGKIPHAVKVPGLRGNYLYDPAVIDKLAETA